MLTENFVAATLAANKPFTHLNSSLKDVGVFLYEYQPQTTFHQGFKKSSVESQCLAIGEKHIYAAQAEKAIIHVYNRAKGNQEATIPFPDKIKSIAYADKAAVLVVGFDDGKLALWEISTGRISMSSAAHLQAVSHLSVSKNNDIIVSGSPDSNLHIWTLSQLLSFTDSASPFRGETSSKKSPARSFTRHRSVITALTIGNSATATNFAISISTDQTCYIWHTQTCQILRTLLLPAVALSIAIDPADRVLYFGCENGNILHADIFGPSTRTSRSSVFDGDTAAIQVAASENWVASSEVGSARCLTLTYDGTGLISGHQGGKIIRWDTAKHRIVTEIADLNQPISHIEMLTPIGLPIGSLRYTIPTIVKPKLDLSIQANDSLLNIPSTYTLQAQVIGHKPLVLTGNADPCAGLYSPGFPTAVLDEAIRAIMLGADTTSSIAEVSQRDVNSEVHLARLTDENAALKKRLDSMIQLEEEHRQKHLARREQREAYRKKRVDAFATATKHGQDGDVAMKPIEEKERMLDIESEDEYLTENR